VRAAERRGRRGLAVAPPPAGGLAAGAPAPRGAPQPVVVPFSYCPRCAAPLADPASFVQEYWVAVQTRFSCWCRACSFAFEIALSDRVTGHETRSQP